MSATLRYRLIQILEILLWLGFLVGLARLALRLYSLRGEGWRTMLDLAGLPVLGGGAIVIALLVLIGIYHNGRRNADALDRLARQGAGGFRRVSAAVRPDEPPQQKPVEPTAPPEAASPRDDAPRFSPAPVLRAHPPGGSAPQSRRIGPAS
ncbi:hypothetical protein SAMN05421538_10688 [Paracoccus isoporae]|uniref:Uncharacterized protein n=1 Tax=Paracoccus isoporae TaxID=591205 RepID=A0A1G7CHY0_9RHOB|nr:hypothetical protein [Paracoccus isoporae]SDE38340.1 hypothetical protein SAMN05421538_10688 [Paracoccus isoporae]